MWREALERATGEGHWRGALERGIGEGHWRGALERGNGEGRGEGEGRKFLNDSQTGVISSYHFVVSIHSLVPL